MRFGPAGARVERERKIGTNPTELVGPARPVRLAGRPVVLRDHGARHAQRRAVEVLHRDRRHRRAESSSAGFPATVQVAPDGHYAWVVNFNLYGDMVPSSVSVVWTDQMLEVHRIPTCVMPHGSRLSPDGTPPLLGLHDERRAGGDRRGPAWRSRATSC